MLGVRIPTSRPPCLYIVFYRQVRMEQYDDELCAHTRTEERNGIRSLGE